MFRYLENVSIAQPLEFDETPISNSKFIVNFVYSPVAAQNGNFKYRDLYQKLGKRMVWMDPFWLILEQ